MDWSVLLPVVPDRVTPSGIFEILEALDGPRIRCNRCWIADASDGDDLPSRSLIFPDFRATCKTLGDLGVRLRRNKTSTKHRVTLEMPSKVGVSVV